MTTHSTKFGTTGAILTLALLASCGPSSSTTDDGGDCTTNCGTPDGGLTDGGYTPALHPVTVTAPLDLTADWYVNCPGHDGPEELDAVHRIADFADGTRNPEACAIYAPKQEACAGTHSCTIWVFEPAWDPWTSGSSKEYAIRPVLTAPSTYVAATRRLTVSRDTPSVSIDWTSPGDYGVKVGNAPTPVKYCDEYHNNQTCNIMTTTWDGHVVLSCGYWNGDLIGGMQMLGYDFGGDDGVPGGLVASGHGTISSDLSVITYHAVHPDATTFDRKYVPCP